MSCEHSHTATDFVAQNAATANGPSKEEGIKVFGTKRIGRARGSRIWIRRSIDQDCVVSYPGGLGVRGMWRIDGGLCEGGVGYEH
jgi:hypothetical protein